MKLGHLRRMEGLYWRTPQQLSEEAGVISLRLLERLRGQVLGSLAPSLLDSFCQAKGEEPLVFPVLRLAAGPEGPSLGFFKA